MNKIIEYILLSYDTTDILTGGVNRFLEEGFVPYGSPYFSDSKHNQAMVKYESKKQVLVEDNKIIKS